ncbi:hypothetical protein Vadar_028323 [Vaccinium darrowii]|uniref:Uncharacterized protein n=1 Tax=Vaccinium darrowii TaxID=229202 RepID=A0ACB7ZNC7_9ERIC|nr:hypothetical protein Vadar_028323 [Vaccinium darrowii]
MGMGKRKGAAGGGGGMGSGMVVVRIEVVWKIKETVIVLIVECKVEYQVERIPKATQVKLGAFLKLFLSALLLTTATTTASTSFDYWKLALQWPPALQLGNSGAYVPPQLKFTIHGLWHDNFTTFTRCPVPQQPFNINLFSWAFVNRLFLCWPNVERAGNNQGFWAGEWHRHGGCSELQYDQLRYFELAADLYDQHFDIFGVLTRASVPRSYVNSVPLATISSSIIANTTKVSILTCRWYQDLCGVRYNGAIDCCQANRFHVASRD